MRHQAVGWLGAATLEKGLEPGTAAGAHGTRSCPLGAQPRRGPAEADYCPRTTTNDPHYCGDITL